MLINLLYKSCLVVYELKFLRLLFSFFPFFVPLFLTTPTLSFIPFVFHYYSFLFLCFSPPLRVFTRESNYCFQRVLAIVILSVCLSVRLSHGWISQKRCKVGSPNFHRRLHGKLWFQKP